MPHDDELQPTATPISQHSVEKPIPTPPKKRNGSRLRWVYRQPKEWSPVVYRQVYALAKAQSTLEECAAYLGWTEAGLERQLRRHGWDSFSQFQKTAINKSRAELRRTLLAQALSGKHPSATVFYAKSLLGMSDKALEAMERDEVQSLTAAEVDARLAALDGEPLKSDDDPAEPPPKKRKHGRPKVPPQLPEPEKYGYEDDGK